jgi:small subunit ribosomal protein S5
MGPKNNRRDNRNKPEEQEKQFDERVINIDRVARVVKGGRRFRFRALVVVGDKKGRLGIGIAKGADVTTAVSKAVDVAKKNFITVNLHKGSIPHEASAKLSGAHILIKPASAGTGLIAGGVVRTILEVAGVHDALSKSLGSTNKVNTAYATMDCLKALVPKSDWVVRPVKIIKTTAKAEAVVTEKTEKVATKPVTKPAKDKVATKKVTTKKESK